MTQPSETPTEPSSWNPSDWVVYARGLAESLSAAREEVERLDKLVFGYYGQASEGWTKFREAERTLKAAQSALAEKERELESLREKLEELPEEPEHFTEWRKAPLANSETLRYIDALRAYALSLRGRIRLSDFINAADISASDLPHQVVKKLQAAIDAALGEGKAT